MPDRVEQPRPPAPQGEPLTAARSTWPGPTRGDAVPRDSPPGDPLVNAQRAYLYGLHRAAGNLPIGFGAVALGIALCFVPVPPGDLSSIRVAAFAGLTLVLVSGAWVLFGSVARLILWDPDHRRSTPLFLLAPIVRSAGLAGVALTGFGVYRALERSIDFPAAISLGRVLWAVAPVVSALSVVLLLGLALVVGTQRAESLLRRTGDRGGSTWAVPGVLAVSFALAAVLTLVLPPIGALLGLGVAALAGASLGGRALLLRARVGVILRELEKAEPGAYFEPVARP